MAVISDHICCEFFEYFLEGGISMIAIPGMGSPQPATPTPTRRRPPVQVGGRPVCQVPAGWPALPPPKHSPKFLQPLAVN